GVLRYKVCHELAMSDVMCYYISPLLSWAHYDERYDIPTAHQEEAHSLEELVTECSLDYEGGPGMMGDSGPFGEGSGDQALPIAEESFHALRQRQTSDTIASPDDKDRRVNLLNWDGLGTGGLFPRKKDRAVAPQFLAGTGFGSDLF